MISRYLFLDWVGMALGMLGLWMLGNHDRRGFVAFILSNVLWIVVGVWVSSLAIILGNAILLVTNARGWLRWRRMERVREEM